MLCFKITFPLSFKATLRTVKRAQLVRALAAHPENLSSVPKAYVIEGDSLGGCPLTSTCGPWHLCTYTHMLTHIVSKCS